MTEETKAKIKAAHLERAKDPAVRARLKALANDETAKAARSAKMKTKWADPEWRANQLAKMATTTRAREVETPVRKKRIISDEKKALYAANRKAKRSAAKAAKA